MEFLISIIIIIALCLCLGVSAAYIMAGALIFLEVILILITVFFVWCVILLAGAEKVSGSLSRIEKNPKGSFDTAYYTVDGEDYPNYLPAEVAFRNRFYSNGKTVKLRLNRKKKCVFDRNGLLTVIFGIVLGAASVIAVAAGLISTGIISLGK